VNNHSITYDHATSLYLRNDSHQTMLLPWILTTIIVQEEGGTTMLVSMAITYHLNYYPFFLVCFFCNLCD